MISATCAGGIGINQVAQFLFRPDQMAQGEIIGYSIGFDERPRGRRAVLIVDGQRNVAHVIGGGVAQQKEHHDGHDKGDGQRARVTEDLDELFANQADESAAHGYIQPCKR
jgi:hypothetical protein